MAVQEDAQIALAARSLVYKMMHSVLGNEPSTELLDAAAGEAVNQACSLFVAEEDSPYAVALAAWLKAADDAKRGDIDDLHSSYNRLFIGPHELCASPWESVYVNRERLLFQESTLHVRHAYAAQGFIPAKYPHVADDHISLEADFMARLGFRAAEAYEAGDIDTAKKALAASLDFLRGHLLKWISKYAEAMREGTSDSGFYCAAVNLLEQFATLDEVLIEEIRTAL